MRAYTNGPPGPTSPAAPHWVTGSQLAKAKRSRQQRAHLAAALANGSVAVYPLLVNQAASLLKVPQFDVTEVRRNGNGKKPRHGRETLAQHIARSSPAERLAAARIIGPAELWDTMISPVITEERASQQAAE
jgi:hypothetical protein